LLLLLAGWDFRQSTEGDRGLDTHAILARHEALIAEAKRAGDRRSMAEHAALACNGAQYVRFARDNPNCVLATSLARELGDVDIEGYVHGCQATFAVWLVDFDDARRHIEQGRALIAGHDAPDATFALEFADGVLHHEKADYERARAALQRSLQAAERMGSPFAITLAESSLARLYYAVGDLAAAERWAARALDHAFLMLDPNGEWVARWVLGLVEDDRGRKEHSLAQWRLGVIAARRGRIFWGETLLSTNVSYALLALDRVEEAAPFAQEKRRLLDAGILPQSWEPELEQLEGSVAYGRGDYQAAVAHFERARQTNKGRLIVRALLAKARSLYHLRRLDEARTAYRELIRQVEATREGAAEDQRGSYLAANLAGYQELISLLWDMSGPAAADEAFAVAEAGRARSLLDALHAAGKGAQPIPAISTAALRERLAPGQAFVAWVSTKERLLAIAITRDEIRFALLPGAGTRDALAERVRFYRRLLEEIVDPAEAAPAGRKLYDDLIAPILPAGIDTLLVSPDGPLAYLPLDALVTPDGRFLVETVAVAQVPSAALAFGSAERDATTKAPVLAVADPPPREGFPALPHARAEASVVVDAAQGDGRLLVGEGASERAVKETSGQRASIWHFATHARTDEAIPLRSALVLAGGGDDDGMLTAAEIYGLRLPAAIVVLSGCETGTGAWLGGEGAQSLSRAFQFAGASSVVSTLWAIGDRSSEPVMAAFYRRLAAGDSVPAALAGAKREQIQQGAPPRAWAAFLASGAPDARAALGTPRGRATWFLLPGALVAGLALVWALRRRK